MIYALDQHYNLIVDNITCLLALFLIFLIKRTLIKNKKVFGIIFATLIFVLFACGNNLLWYYIVNNYRGHSLMIYITKNNYYICNMIVLFLNVYYINYLSNYNTFKQTRILYFNFLVTAICSVLQLVTPLTNFGYHREKVFFVSTMPDPFTIAFLVGYLSILYMLIKNNTGLVRQLRDTLLLSNLLCLILTIHNIITLETSYITFTFMIPLLTVLFTQHSNPYEYDTGALDYESFNTFLHDNAGKEYYFMFLKLYKDKDELSKELKKGLMNFYYNAFKKAQLFYLADNSYVLVISKEGNKTEEKIDGIIHELVYTKFRKYYEQYKVNYKIQLIQFTNEFTSLADFKFVTKHYLNTQATNSLMFITREQVKEIKGNLSILNVLKDIDIQKNFNDKRVLVYCQPVKNIKTGQYDTAEALMRLDIPDMGIITPDKFIALAEQEDLIHSLSMIILNKTCKAVYDLQEQGLYIDRVSVNFSQVELQNKHFVSDVVDIIDTIGIDHKKIAIEVTENVDDTDYVTMIKCIGKLKKENIFIYLDDFGTGYNNFDRMLSLHLDVLKFDRSLLLYALKEKKNNFILEHFAYMFKQLGYKVLFEGVETKEQEDFCKKSHADYIQGYLYSKPVPIEELKNFLSPSQTENSSKQN